MAAASGLTFVLDQNLGSKALLEILRLARMPPENRITSLSELGFSPDALDEEWMPALGRMGSYVVVTRDGEILRASIRLAAWAASGISLVLLDGRWGQLSLPALVRALVYWWPLLVEQAEAGKPGTAWTVPDRVPPSTGRGIRLVTPKSGRSGGGGRGADVLDLSAAAARRRKPTR